MHNNKLGTILLRLYSAVMVLLSLKVDSCIKLQLLSEII